MTAGGPTPIFREEAKAETVKCPSCGGPIQRTGFGAITTIACSYCGAELTPESSGALSVLRHVRRQQRASVLPLHLRGRFDGETFEVIGIVWREVTADGKVYPWQEFLLFNPYVGYRYLLHFIYDGHWALGRPLDGAPAVTPGARPTAEFRRQRYRHFQRSNVRTTYVEGEFPWQIAVGDQVIADDFVAPPLGLSIERSNDQDRVDLQFTQMEHLDGAAIYRAFGLAGTPARAADRHAAAQPLAAGRRRAVAVVRGAVPGLARGRDRLQRHARAHQAVLGHRRDRRADHRRVRARRARTRVHPRGLDERGTAEQHMGVRRRAAGAAGLRGRGRGWCRSRRLARGRRR
ncbi:MAG: DUF4178 domain-containing protein [Deltaproteobacteria bacterium]|nr:DUF4178 domain-containing protein [Deltaproteobacteria bacterium]